MAAPVRFLFDTDFAAPPPRPEPVAPPEPTVTVRELEQRLAAAERKAYERGMAEGRTTAEAVAASRLVDETKRLADAVESILDSLEGECRSMEADAMRLAEVVARKLAGTLIDRFPRDMVLAVLEESFGQLRKAPHLVVRIAAEDVTPIQGELKRMAGERGFEGRLVVLPEPGMARGDCRLEWADGGIVLDRAATEAAVARAIENHLLPEDAEDGALGRDDEVS